MDAIRLHSDGTLSSEAPFAGLLRMRLELDGDVTLRSFFRLLKRNPLARELVPGLGDALAEAEACPASGCRYPGLEALRLGKRVELTGFPGTPRVDVYLAVEGVGDELPELRFFRLRDMLDTPLVLAVPPVPQGDGPACPARRDSDRVGRGNQLHSV